MTRWLGIDAGEGFHEMVLLDASGQKARSVKVANRADAIESALRGLVQSAEGEVTVEAVPAAHRLLNGSFAYTTSP